MNRVREKECLHSLQGANEPKEPSNNIKKLVAFTLAEVLITLAIIGVVAALTIPTLVTNYQKKMYVTELKKSYNNLSNGFKTIMAQDGVTKLEDTALWSKIPVDYADSYQMNQEDYKPFFDEFKKTFKVLTAYSKDKMPEQYAVTFKCLDGSCGDTNDKLDYGIFLADGSWLDFHFHKIIKNAECEESIPCKSLSEFQQKRNTKTKYWSYAGDLTIDVNGFKGPNIIGRDIFLFELGNDGMLYPWGGIELSIHHGCMQDGLSGCDYYWKNQDTHYGCSLDSDGSGCAGRIMEEGWKMTY